MVNSGESLFRYTLYTLNENSYIKLHQVVSKFDNIMVHDIPMKPILGVPRKQLKKSCGDSSEDSPIKSILTCRNPALLV